jgi:hypothetical protein
MSDEFPKTHKMIEWTKKTYFSSFLARRLVVGGLGLQAGEEEMNNKHKNAGNFEEGGPDNSENEPNDRQSCPQPSWRRWW